MLLSRMLELTVGKISIRNVVERRVTHQTVVEIAAVESIVELQYLDRALQRSRSNPGTVA